MSMEPYRLDTRALRFPFFLGGLGLQLDVDLTQDGPEVIASTTARIDLSAYGITPRLGIVRPKVDLEVRGRLIQSPELLH